jgi:ABC-type branched-subunit amino acid transport system permease subunit
VLNTPVDGGPGVYLHSVTVPAIGPTPSSSFYLMALAAAVATLAIARWIFVSRLGIGLFAIHDDEDVAEVMGVPTYRYKLVAFVASATITGLAGVLLMFNNRMTSAEPISVAFSGELLAMVIIGGMRSFMGPAVGALFFVIFRDSLSRVTENWLLYFGLLFVAFVVFSPEGLVGLYERLTRRWRPKPVTDAAMASREAGDSTLPDSLKPTRHGDGPILVV